MGREVVLMKKDELKILIPKVAGKKDGVYTVVNSDMTTMFEGTAKECCDYIDHKDFETTKQEAQLNSSVDNFEKFFGAVRFIDE